MCCVYCEVRLFVSLDAVSQGAFRSWDVSVKLCVLFSQVYRLIDTHTQTNVARVFSHWQLYLPVSLPDCLTLPDSGLCGSRTTPASLLI